MVLGVGLFQKDVAQRLGVDTDSVTNWENGRSSPRLHLIPKVIQFLGYVPFQDEGRSLGERVVRFRRSLGIRQDQLSHQLGVDPSTLARWERNEGKTLPELRRRVDAFLVSETES